ncbi:hypothetical protein GTQ99_05590 [Kineococcus sp. T13]|uniref:PilN domain-containing protein n=1 Tax=Kineococcus vitellinus TaxID=2696565 RepID=UPI001411BE06|nr:PilN domain-containing protein [Kineococcus vitellinus]NAZ74898.1 hypothetical protein [Kineococcus vitellinus]
MSLQTLDALTTRTSVVRVDLLPREVAAARGSRLLRIALGAGLAVVAGVACAATLVTAGHVSTAEEALAAEQQRTLQLQQAQRAYADVPVVLAQLEDAEDVRRQVTAGDVPTYLLLDQLAARAPLDLALTAVEVAVDAGSAAGAAASSAAGSATAPAAGAAAEVVGTDPLAVAGIGTVSVTGQTKSQAQVAAFMDAVDTVGGMTGTRLSSSTLDPTTGLITFTTTATLTDDALSSTR